MQFYNINYIYIFPSNPLYLNDKEDFLFKTTFFGLFGLFIGYDETSDFRYYKRKQK